MDTNQKSERSDDSKRSEDSASGEADVSKEAEAVPSEASDCHTAEGDRSTAEDEEAVADENSAQVSGGTETRGSPSPSKSPEHLMEHEVGFFVKTPSRRQMFFLAESNLTLQNFSASTGFALVELFPKSISCKLDHPLKLL